MKTEQTKANETFDAPNMPFTSLFKKENSAVYSAFDINRKMPATAITTPRTTKMLEKWLMSPAGGVRDVYEKIAPIMTSTNPNSFSVTAKLRGISVLMLESSRFNFTVSRLILIYLSLA